MVNYKEVRKLYNAFSLTPPFCKSHHLLVANASLAQGIRIINLVYFSQIINLLPLADLRRICESFRPRCHPDGTREFTMRVLRKSAESA